MPTEPITDPATRLGVTIRGLVGPYTEQYHTDPLYKLHVDTMAQLMIGLLDGVSGACGVLTAGDQANLERVGWDANHRPTLVAVPTKEDTPDGT